MVYAIIVPTIEFLFLGCGLTGLLHQNTYKTQVLTCLTINNVHSGDQVK